MDSKTCPEFVNSFLLFVTVSDYRVVKGRYTEVGANNSSLVGLLKRAGLCKASVKAIEFSPLDHVPAGCIIPYEDKMKEKEGLVAYYKQVRRFGVLQCFQY